MYKHHLGSLVIRAKARFDGPLKPLVSPFHSKPCFMAHIHNWQVVHANHVGMRARHEIQGNNLRFWSCCAEFLTRLANPKLGGNFPIITHCYLPPCSTRFKGPQTMELYVFTWYNFSTH